MQEEKADKQILHNLSGSVAPGEMLAIMGPSGCGKSSLLNILSTRRGEDDGATGELKINGASYPDSFRRLSGYVTQDFQFFEYLTVRETLTIAAKLTLPSSQGTAEKLARVEKLLSELDLTRASETMIGSPTNPENPGISGGERRRLCIAMELMNNPPLLFLDEPTSGLDAASALMVVDLLKRQTLQGKTVVCVIHQPRASILPLFDQVLLMGAGKVVYYGPSCDFAAETDPLRSFFVDAGHPCPPFENPADHILDIINTTSGEAEGGDETAKLEQRQKTADTLAKYYATTALSKQMVGNMALGGGSPLPGIEGNVSSKYATSWFTQCFVLVGRTFKLKFRDPMSFMTILSSVIVIAVLQGSIYYDMPQGDWQNRIGGVAMFISFMSFLCFDILMLWPAEKQVYLRDQRSGMYSTSAFYVARSAAEAPIHIICGFLGGMITYHMYGLSCSMFEFSIMSGLVISTAAAVFMAVSSISKTFEQANQLAMPILTIFFLFSGFFVPATKIPAMWTWVPDVNFLYFAVNYVIVVEIKAMTHCDSLELMPNSTQLAPMDCDVALVAAGFDPEMTFMVVAMNLIWTNVVFRAIAYLGLRFCHTGQTIKQRCAE